MRRFRLTLLVIDLFLTAAIAGFFYAYTSTVMRGLDEADPAVAIAAMQAINANVRNAVFAPSFFGPLIVGLFVVLVYGLDIRLPAWLARAGFLVYAAGGFIATLAINVPMNEALALASVPPDAAAAQKRWSDYSGPWMFWNTMRTVLSFVSFGLLLAAAIGEARER